MLYTITIVLFIFWLVEVIAGYQLGAFTHLLLAIAILFALLKVIRGKPAL